MSLRKDSALLNLNNTPQFPKTVVVPVSKPETAEQMLELAVLLADPEEGRVIALTVAMGDDKEKTNDAIEALRSICERFIEDGHNVELVTYLAGAVTRGILDGTREYGGDMLLLGVHQHQRRQVKLGHVVENIIAAAPCDVLVYRMAQSKKFRRVIVALDGTPESLNALYAGVLIAKSRDVNCTVYQLHNRAYRVSQADRIDDLLNLLPGDQIERRMIFGKDPSERILRQVHGDDLLCLGFSQKTDLDEQMREVLSDVLLNRAPSPVLMASRLIEQRGSIQGAIQHRIQRFNVSLTPVERNELIWEGQKNSQATVDYIVMIILSAFLASLGLLLDSVAVIIGAMLVAPLMSPLGALSTGLASGQLVITRRAAFSLIQGVLLALLVSVVAGSILLIDVPTPEMTSRGNPTLLDAAVALVSGLVAAYAIARKEVPAALAGVAIAAALMPPICTIGLGIALGDLQLAAGASLLFTANIVFIVVSQYIVFLWIGLRPSNRRETRRGVLAWWGIIGSLLVFVVALLIQLSLQALDEIAIENLLLDELPRSEFVDIETLTRDGGDTLEVIFSVRTERLIAPQQVAEAEANLATILPQFKRVILEVVAMQVVRPYTGLEAQVVDYIEATFQPLRINEITIREEEATLMVIASILTQDDVTPEQMNAAAADLTDLLQMPVQLALFAQPMTTGTAQIMPQATPEAAAVNETAD